MGELMPIVSEQNRDIYSEKNVYKYYLGQNLYQKENRNRDKTFIQDFYQNPSFGQRSSITKQLKSRVDKTSLSEKESFDNFSDNYSVTSDESDNFKPRIIKPRRRRKKEKKRHTAGGKVVSQELDDVCLGSENQWLPQGLLSAESESCGDCGDSVRSESDQEVSSSSSSSSVKSHRKLAATLSVPTFSSSSYTSFSEVS